MYLAMFAAAYGQVGQAAEGLRQVIETREMVNTAQERWWKAESIGSKESCSGSNSLP